MDEHVLTVGSGMVRDREGGHFRCRKSQLGCVYSNLGLLGHRPLKSLPPKERNLTAAKTHYRFHQYYKARKSVNEKRKKISY